MMLRRCIILSLMLSVSILVLGFSAKHVECATPPETEWQRTYGGTAAEQALSILQTGDGGYLLAGHTESFGSGNRDIWLVKTDAGGNIEWNKTHGGRRGDMAFSVVETGDGGYALAGRTNSFGAGTADFWLVKVDSSGNHQWNKTYGGSSLEAARCVVETGDGGYALAGFTESFGAGGQDFWLVKVDSSGNHEWNKTYGGTGVDNARSVVETSDGGYVLAGETDSFGAGNTDFWLVKADSSGNHEWNKTYGGTLVEGAFSVVETGDGGYALAGRTRSLGEGRLDFWLVKVDSSGNHQWNQTYGGGANDPAHSMIEANVVETCDGGYALAGFTLSFGAGGQDGWLVKTDASGNMEWNKTYGGVSNDVLNSVIMTADKGYALGGFTESFGAGGQDFWLVKVAGPPEYTLTIDSSPVGVGFLVDDVSQVAPWLGIYEECTTVSLEMPEVHVVGNSRYYWSQWSDGNTSRLRTVAMGGNTTLSAVFSGPYYELTVESSPVAGVQFKINGIPRSTVHVDWLLEASYTIEMPETHNGYVWSHWLEDGDTSRIKTIALSGTEACTAVYKIPVGGTTVSIRSGHSSFWIASIVLITSVVAVSSFFRHRYKRK